MTKARSYCDARKMMFARFMWSLVVVVCIIMMKTGGHGSEGVRVLCYGCLGKFSFKIYDADIVTCNCMQIQTISYPPTDVT